jgi:hypothetical protein
MNDKLRETAQAALLALKCLDGLECAREEIENLEAALAEPTVQKSLTVAEQEPVAWTTMPEAEDWCFVSLSKDPTGKLEGKWFPLYTAPPRREWVGLTNDEVNSFAAGCHLGNSVQGAIYKAEAKLREKNT